MVVRKNKRYTLVGSLQFGQGIPQGARERLRNDFPGARGAGYAMAVWHSCGRIAVLDAVPQQVTPGTITSRDFASLARVRA